MTDNNYQRRETDVKRRLERQDEILEDLRVMMVNHELAHKITDPALIELVDIFKGMRLIKKLTIALVAIIGSIWSFVTIFLDHFKFRS